MRVIDARAGDNLLFSVMRQLVDLAGFKLYTGYKQNWNGTKGGCIGRNLYEVKLSPFGM